jgi:hypothetical protein
MSLLAANPSALHYPSLCAIEQAIKLEQTSNEGGELPRFYRLVCRRRAAADMAEFNSQSADDYFDPACFFLYVSRLLLGHGFGAFPAPGGTASFCFGCAAFQVMVPP